MKKKLLENFEFILQLNYSFYCGLVFFQNFDITMYFLSPHFSFFVCDKHNVIISKVHNEYTLFLKHIHNFQLRFSLKSIVTWIMKKLKLLMFDMILRLKFIYNLEKLQLRQSK